MQMVRNIGTRAANDGGFRAVLKRVARSLRRSEDTPLAEAAVIMSKSMHTIMGAEVALGHDRGFRQHNSQLMIVPYSVDELEWAVEHGVVLTLYTSAVNRLMHVGRGKIDVPSEVLKRCSEDVLRAPSNAEWKLVLRTSALWQEEEFLKSQPKSLQRRAFVPELGLALSTAFLDFKIHDLKPKGNRLTASTLKKRDGTVERRILVGNNGFGDGPPIRAMTAHEHAQYPAAVGWKPNRITV